MNTEIWVAIIIAIVTIIAQFISQFGATWWQIKEARATAKPATNQPTEQINPATAVSPLWYRWQLRLFFIILNFVACYVLVETAQSSEPLTRSSATLIAAMVGVMVICFICPLLINVYYYFESLDNR